MKQLTCEMCGSGDIVKQNGLFVCQFCGTRYSVEEAKKMMIDGTVAVQGTVKVDNTSFVEKYLINARRAKSKEDWEETEKYYNMVEENAPDNIEAIFYSSYAKVMNLLIDSDYYKREAAFNVLTKSVSLIDDNYTEDYIEIVKAIDSDIFRLTSSSFIYTETKNGYGEIVESDKDKTQRLFTVLHSAWVESLHNIVEMTQNSECLFTLHQLIYSHKSHCNIFEEKTRSYISNTRAWLYKNSNSEIQKAIADEYEEDRQILINNLKSKKEAIEEQFNNRMIKADNPAIVLIVLGIFSIIINFISESDMHPAGLLAGIPLLVGGIYMFFKKRKSKIEELYPEYSIILNEITILENKSIADLINEQKI